MVKQIQLGEMVDINPESISKDFPHKEIEYIDISSVGSGSLINNPETIRLDVAPSRAKRKVQESDTILAMVRPNLRSFMYIRNPKENTIVSTGFAVLRPKDNVDPRFIYYCVSNPVFTGYLTNNAKGTSYPAVDTKTITRGYIPNFKFDDQEKIGQLLVLYDDLIVNNKRRIELLEESARQLYKEWFVRFRFPGHEHVKIVDGVPEGWKKLKISDLCTVGRGASPRPIQNYMDGEIPWFKIADATASESPFIFETKEKVIETGAQKSVYLPEGELILSNSATCGVPNFTGVKGCIHDGWLYFKGLKTVDKWFLYLYLVFQQKALLQGIGEGATQKNLNTTYVGNQIITIPDSEVLLQSFTDLVEPVFLQIKTLASYNRQLANARDLLLPKLMNGEIAV